MNQRLAFLVQARSDYALFVLLGKQDGVPPCHRLHYLQMCSEKLAKAVRLSPAGGAVLRKSHVAFSKLTSLLTRQPALAAALGQNLPAYRDFIARGASLRSEIEELAPAVAGDRPNCEYPWRARDAAGHMDWFAPATSPFPLEVRLRGYPGNQLLKLIGLLLDRFDEFF